MFFEKVVFFITLWLSAFNLGFAGDDSGDVIPSPTASGYFSYEAVPTPPSLPGNPLYGAPSPPQQKTSKGKCPPTPPVQCCQTNPIGQYTPPAQYNPYTPPGQYTPYTTPGQYAPPSPYGLYVPYHNQAPQSPMPVFLSVMMLLFSSAVLF